MPTLIDGGPNISVHLGAWNALMKNSDSLALSQLWLCSFNKQQLANVGDWIDTTLPMYEPDMWSKDQSTVNYRSLHPDKFFGSSAGESYMLVQGINFVPDGIDTSRQGMSQTGAIKGLIGNQRLELNATNITFLESNVSFTDGFLRPWSILTGYRSLKDPNSRVDIELICLKKWTLYEPLKISKRMKFKNAVPINIDAEELNYTGDKLILRQVQFAFDRYILEVFSDVTSEGITEQDLYSSNMITLNPEVGEGKIIPGAIVYEEKDNIGPDNYITNANGKSIIDSVKDLLGTVNDVVNDVRGIANDVTSNIAQGLNAFGLTDQANSVSNYNRRFQRDIIQPVTNVITTGQSYVGGAESIGNAVRILTGNNRPIQAQVTAPTPTANTNPNQAQILSTPSINESSNIGRGLNQSPDVMILESGDFEISVPSLTLSEN